MHIEVLSTEYGKSIKVNPITLKVDLINRVINYEFNEKDFFLNLSILHQIQINENESEYSKS
jgi:hypothetical protein